jgi:hypothetical protein
VIHDAHREKFGVKKINTTMPIFLGHLTLRFLLPHPVLHDTKASRLSVRSTTHTAARIAPSRGDPLLYERATIDGLTEYKDKLHFGAA